MWTAAAQPGPDQALARFRVVDTRLPDEAREEVGRIFCPHFLNPLARRPELFHARHDTRPYAGYRLNFVAYGAAVEIDPGELSAFFLLQIPVKGRAHVRCGTLAAEAEAGRMASVLSPTLPTRMVWQDGCEKIIVLIERDIVERQFAVLSGGARQPVEFQTAVDLSTSTGRAIARHVGFMLDGAGDEDPPPGYQAHLRDGLVDLMLTGLAHKDSRLLAGPAADAGPAALRRARAYIADHAADPLSLADIAAAAGASARSLQQAFRLHVGSTVIEAVRDARLDLFRRLLTTDRQGRAVGELALAAGLGHFGRAAASYREKFGESPSETLRRRRGPT